MVVGLQQQQGMERGLVVGNYCHDVLIRDGRVIGESLGGAVSFVSNVLDPLDLSCSYVSKVGPDFAYTVAHSPSLASCSSETTLFHAHFFSDHDQDRILKRIHACDSIFPSDLPIPSPSFPPQFDFGLAVGVAGEIPPETLTRMLDVCRIVFVDVQGLIRAFDPVDGTVKLIPLRDSGFFHLIPRIGFLKASSEEAPFIDIEEVRKWSCVIVTDGRDGCRVYWKDEELRIPSFPAVQIDPTGAGDSFLGGFVAGLVRGLAVQDAALLGNFFGSLTVEQIGVPKFDSWMLQKVKAELERTMGCSIDFWERREVAAADLGKLGVYDDDLRVFLGGVAKLRFPNHRCLNGLLDMRNSTQAVVPVCYQQNGDQEMLLTGSANGVLQDIDNRDNNLHDL